MTSPIKLVNSNRIVKLNKRKVALKSNACLISKGCIVGAMKTRVRTQGTGLLLILLIGVALAVAGCGGSSSDSAATAASAAGSTSNSDEPSAQFLKPGEENPTVEFGHEASPSEREAVSKVVEKSLKARAAGDFATQCQTLSLKAIKQVPGATSRQKCAKALAELAVPVSETAKTRKDTLKGPIDAMRVKGTSGYALYHGTDGKDYSLPLEKEAGTWKVASILTTEV
jgi:hypothetical protein